MDGGTEEQEDGGAEGQRNKMMEGQRNSGGMEGQRNKRMEGQIDRGMEGQKDGEEGPSVPECEGNRVLWGSGHTAIPESPTQIRPTALHAAPPR